MKEGDIVIFIGDRLSSDHNWCNDLDYITNNKAYKVIRFDKAFEHHKYQYQDRFWILNDKGIPNFFNDDDEDWISIKEIRKLKLEQLQQSRFG